MEIEYEAGLIFTGAPTQARVMWCGKAPLHRPHGILSVRQITAFTFLSCLFFLVGGQSAAQPLQKKPAVALADVDFAAGTGGVVTVPAGSGINLRASVNGQGPFDLVFDTGASNLMSASLARRLNLKMQGSASLSAFGGGATAKLTTVKALQIGGLVIRDQRFFVVDAPGSGDFLFIGYEMLKRMVIKIDYEREQMTFYDAPSFHYTGTGTPVEIRPEGFQVFARGSVDGMPGWFGIDTGDMWSCELFAPFVAQHQLIAHYHARMQGYAGQGIGGADHAFYTRATTLKLGDMQIREPILLLLQDNKGVGASDQAGNIGRPLLKRFTIIFDCGRRTMYLEKNRQYGAPDVFNRAGMLLDLEPTGLRVKTVIADGPAATAGIAEGDLITQIEGVKPDEDNWPGFFARPVGTILHLTAQRAQSLKAVQVTLRNIL